VNTRIFLALKRRAKPWALVVVAFACLARSMADTPPAAPSANAEGLKYNDGSLSEIDQKLADGTTITERLDELHDLIEVTFNVLGDKQQEVDIQPGPDIWSIPTISGRSGDGPAFTYKLRTDVKWSQEAPPTTSCHIDRGYAFWIGTDHYADVIPALACDGKTSLDPMDAIWSAIANSDLESPKSVVIGGQTFPFGNGPITFAPPSTMGNFLPYMLLDGNGKPEVFGLMPSKPSGYLSPGTFTPPPPAPTTFHVPRCVQAGKPVFINGPFTVDPTNMHFIFNGDPVDVLEITQDGAMITLPNNIFGTTNLHIDGDGIHIVAKLTSIGIKLISDDRVLKPDEHDAFRCRVSGLDDLSASITVNIVDEEQDIVSMDDGPHVSFSINPGAGSAVSRDYGLTAIHKGAANIVAWVPQVCYDTPYH